MTDSADDAVIVGREAWARIKENSRRSWDDWLKVGRALQIGRTAALAAAGCNAPVGSKYNVAMGRWLVDHQLDGVVAQERYAIQKILEHLDAVTAWRDGLPEPQRRRHNHPSLWHVFRRATKAETGTSTRQCVRGARSSHKHGKPVYWPQDMLRRAAMALRECGSSDIFRLARVALEAAIRNEADLIELLPPDAVAMSALPRRMDVVSAT
ncbi:MAG: hypothetical protein WBF73_32990, partial [Bradyrhizobium sp.]